MGPFQDGFNLVRPCNDGPFQVVNKVFVANVRLLRAEGGQRKASSTLSMAQNDGHVRQKVVEVCDRLFVDNVAVPLVLLVLELRQVRP